MPSSIYFNHGLPWSDDDRRQAVDMNNANERLVDIARLLGRTCSAVRCELERLGGGPQYTLARIKRYGPSTDDEAFQRMVMCTPKPDDCLHMRGSVRLNVITHTADTLIRECDFTAATAYVLKRLRHREAVGYMDLLQPVKDAMARLGLVGVDDCKRITFLWRGTLYRWDDIYYVRVATVIYHRYTRMAAEESTPRPCMTSMAFNAPYGKQTWLKQQLNPGEPDWVEPTQEKEQEDMKDTVMYEKNMLIATGEKNRALHVKAVDAAKQRSMQAVIDFATASAAAVATGTQPTQAKIPITVVKDLTKTYDKYLQLIKHIDGTAVPAGSEVDFLLGDVEDINKGVDNNVFIVSHVL